MKTAYEWMMSIPPSTPLADLKTEIEKMVGFAIAEARAAENEACAIAVEEAGDSSVPFGSYFAAIIRARTASDGKGKTNG